MCTTPSQPTLIQNKARGFCNAVSGSHNTLDHLVWAGRGLSLTCGFLEKERSLGLGTISDLLLEEEVLLRFIVLRLIK